MAEAQETLFTYESEDFEGLLLELQKVEKYPFDRPRDVVFLRTLIDEFPTLDLKDEIRQWRVWLMDAKLGRKKVNYRGRFRTWCKQAVRFRRARSSGGKRQGFAGAASSYSGTSPAAHGATTGLEQW